MSKDQVGTIDIENEYSQLSLFLKENDVGVLEETNPDIYRTIELIFEKNNPTTAFYIINLGSIIRQLQYWRELFPYIEPRYAVKCNPNRVICQLLGLLGVGFDVASRGEIDLVKEYVGGDMTKIIYANPYKEPSSIQYARQMDVDIATFDSASELLKIKLYHPGCKLLMRLKVDDSGSICKFSEKFGVDMDEVPSLLNHARTLDLNLVGVCFHVGSGCTSPKQYYSAIEMARKVFNMASEMGFTMNMIDIGGGFSGQQTHKSRELMSGIRDNVYAALCDHFYTDFHIPGFEPPSTATAKRDDEVSDDDLPKLELIAEPGRFFVEASHILLVNLIGKKVKYIKPGARVGCDSSVAPHAVATTTTTISSTNNTTNGEEDDNPAPHKRARLCSIDGEQREKIFYYYLNDGVYGSFNCIYFDHAKVEVLPYNERDGARYRSIIFGPTCDSMDKIQTDIELPELEIGEWCFVRNFGAYTTAAASDFNGFTKKKAFYILN